MDIYSIVCLFVYLFIYLFIYIQINIYEFASIHFNEFFRQKLAALEKNKNDYHTYAHNPLHQKGFSSV